MADGTSSSCESVLHGPARGPILPAISREHVVLGALGMVHQVALRERPKFPWVPHAELVAVGRVALVEASRTFDPNLGTFEAYAVLRVTGAMRDFAMRQGMPVLQRAMRAHVAADASEGRRRRRITGTEIIACLLNPASPDPEAAMVEALDVARRVPHVQLLLERLGVRDAALLRRHYYDEATLGCLAEESDKTVRTLIRRKNRSLKAMRRALIAEEEKTRTRSRSGVCRAKP
jgi:RNA polymerase sigma factor (sigma-70 family)